MTKSVQVAGSGLAVTGITLAVKDPEMPELNEFSKLLAFVLSGPLSEASVRE